MISDDVLKKIQSAINARDVDRVATILSDYEADDISAGHLFSNQTIFMYACEHGTPEIVDVFINKGVSFYELRWGDDTEFKSAARHKQYAFEILTRLIDMADPQWLKELLESNGDDFDEKEGDGLTPADILRSRNDVRSLELIQSVIANVNPGSVPDQ